MRLCGNATLELSAAGVTDGARTETWRVAIIDPVQTKVLLAEDLHVLLDGEIVVRIEPSQWQVVTDRSAIGHDCRDKFQLLLSSGGRRIVELKIEHLQSRCEAQVVAGDAFAVVQDPSFPTRRCRRCWPRAGDPLSPTVGLDRVRSVLSAI
jgi:hypothetical protein